MPKKTPKNAFYFFMLDFKEEQEGKGVKFPNGMKDVADAASPFWKEMHPGEKGSYERMAKEYKVQSQYGDEKFTSQGVSYSELQRRESEKKRLEDSEQAEVSEMIKQSFARSLNPEDVEFYLIDIDLSCITTAKEHVPFEISLAKFSLAKGVTQVYHTFVNTDIPSGYSFDARATAEKHGVTLPFDLGEADIAVILAHLMDFLEFKYQGENCKHPLFTLTRKIDKVKGGLEWLCCYVNANPDTFRVYDLGKMFFTLKNHIATNVKQSFPNESIAQAELTRDVFDFCKGLGCTIDEANDTAIHCTKSQVKRWAYIICDHCCKLTGIPLVPGNHVPDIVDIEGSAKFSRSSSRMTEHSHYTGLSVASECRPTTQMTNDYSVKEAASPVGAWGAMPTRPSTQMSEYSESSVTSDIDIPISKQFSQLNVKNEATASGVTKANSHASKASYSSQVTRGIETGDFRRPYTKSEISKGLLFDSKNKDEFPTLGASRGRGYVGSGRGRGNRI